MRKIVIGDIHGCATALKNLLTTLQLQPDDTLITLGDYIDRGPDSKYVIEQLMAVDEQCTLIRIMGNHELMCMRAFGGSDDLRMWIRYGGKETLASYGLITQGLVPPDPEQIKQVIPWEHMSFIKDCLAYHEDDKNIFVHANYDWDAPMEKQTEQASFWAHMHKAPPPHVSGKTVWVGHTPQVNGHVLDMGHVVCVDTFAFGDDGWLTAMDIDSRQVWQANDQGQRR